MHHEILTKEQIALLPIVQLFSKEFGLVGGTAVAFYFGHRRSIDFDLFSLDHLSSFNNLSIKQRIVRRCKIDEIIVNKKGEFTFIIAGVKMTFFHYPYAIPWETKFDNIIKMPSLLTLAAMKVFALGQRAKWKDYVDLYFVMNKCGGIQCVSDQARVLFGNEFNEKLFRQQLAYFQDVDYREEVIYMPGFEVSENTIKRSLTRFSIK